MPSYLIVIKMKKGTAKDIIKEAHKLDMEVYIDPWGLGKVFGGEAYSNFIAKNIDVMEEWVQNFFVNKGLEEEVKKAYKIVKDNNIDRLMTWAYRGSCCMSTLACEDSEQVWKGFSKI